MNLPENLILKQMRLGPMENFVYFLGDATSRKIAVIDPAWDVDFICREADTLGHKIISVLLTHGHPDHINGVNEITSRLGIPVYISRHENPVYKLQGDVRLLDDRQKIKIGNIEVECILTPGHTPGSQCFKYKGVLITGDTLFIDACGRCDLPGGDAQQLQDSLHNIISNLPDSTVIYPGHQYGPVSYATLEEQKKTNPYLLQKNCF